MLMINTLEGFKVIWTVKSKMSAFQYPIYCFKGKRINCKQKDKVWRNNSDRETNFCAEK